MSNTLHSATRPGQSDETSTVRALRLDSWPCVRVSGADAESFLQGQLSADLRKLGPDDARWSSYNSPKGRMLAVLRLRRTGEAIDLQMPRSLIEPVARRLRMFILRAKVALELPAPASDDAALDAADRLALIRAGVPVVYAQTQDRWVAQMANLDLIGGVSFDKGCYTGQEVVARLHYLGNLKKRMFLVHGTSPVPAPGAAIRDGTGDAQAVGEIVDAVANGTGFIASAVLQLAVAASEHLVLSEAPDSPLQRPQGYTYI